MGTPSYGQRSLWFLQHLAPQGGAYNIAAAARVRTPIDAGALERAFQALVDRHAALRTTFPAIDGAPYRRVAGRQSFSLVCMDAGGWSEQALRARLAEEAWRPFDLERGPLLRVTLLTGDPGGPVILLVVHHIVADFWSLAILVRELPLLYREATGAGPAQLSSPGMDYEEHVRLEAEALAGGRGEALLAYWKERLAGLPALELPLDRPRPAVQTYHGDCCRLRLPGELAAALRARSRERRGTLSMTLAAAFQVLLSRHTGQEDLALGTPRAGRSHSQLAGTVGYFVNPVVLRGDLAGDPTFEELFERTRAAVLAAFEHGEIPLPLLAEHLEPMRDASRTPLFQVSFVMQKETRGAEGLTAFALGEEGVEIGPADFRLASLSLDRPPSPFDLMLHAVERQGGLSFALQYNSDLFDATTAQRLLERFAVLLESIAKGREQALSALPILPAVERHQILCAWNDTAGADSEADLFALFAAQAERSRDEVAVVCGEEQVTYRELAGRVAALAQHLARLGVGPEVLVGVAAERSVEMMVGLLGVLGAGGAYLPLEPDLPRQRLEMILEDARPAVLLTLRSHASALPLDAVPGMRRVWLDGAGGAASASWDEASPTLPLSRPSADNAAYVIYTSGSTGRPKGVVNSHRGILNRLLWMLEAFGLDSGERFLQKTPFGFDVSVPELFTPLILGGRLVLARPDGHRDSAYLVRLVQQEGITTIHFVPSMLPFFLAEEGLAGCRSLHRVLVSGEALPWEMEQRCLMALPVPLYNLYGPTEAAVEVTAWACETAARPRPVPIGRPIRNTRIHVVGRRLEPAPAGAVGELAIGGVQVARGYLGRPDLTAEVFVPDPFSAEGGARLYRTGDLCRHLQRGEIEYLGRLDDQVKIRGFRIEPREIEIALAAHPAVREAAVVVRQSGAGKSLLACVVLREVGADAGALRDFLAARLPAYMVPAFAFGDALDRLPNGKLDRRTLARWTPEAEPARQSLAPRTPQEELLAGLFAEVLGAERIGVDDDFFEQGGHSLAAMRLLARLREVLRVDLPLARVFETPTVAALAAAITESARSDAPPLLPISRDAPLPLSFAQQRLWFLDQLEPGSPLYNMPAAVDLTGRLDRAALAAALSEVVRRHEALRTTFRPNGGAGEPVQIIAPPFTVSLPVLDLQALPGEERREEARRLAAAEARRPFDLGRGPLLRTTLLKLGAERHTVLVTMHHIVSDGWSLGVLVRELGALYAAFAEGRPSPLPELAVQYADYAAWQRRHLSGELLGPELAWWRRQLAGTPAALDLPVDHPRPADRSTRGAVHAFAIGGQDVAGLARLSRRQGATLFMTLLAGFAGLLQRFAGEDDLVIGTPIAGRTRVETEPLIGFFVNTLALRVDLSGDPGFLALLDQVRETALAAYVHQDVPFERLVEELAPERDRSRPPLVQVMLGLQNAEVGRLELPGLDVEASPVPTGTSKLDLACTFTLSERGFAGELEYNRDLFDRTTVQSFAESLGRLLRGAVAEPETRLSSLPVLSHAQRAALLCEWNDTAAACPGPLVHELVVAWAQRQPEALAVAAPGERLTYGELAARSCRLARRLASAGVGPGARVALCAGHTVDRVVGSLAVLLAGGAYVPLDPEAPAERLAFQVDDSGAVAVLAGQRLAGRFQGCAAPLIELAAAGTEAAEEDIGALFAVSPDHLAYVVYTSGSTGRPKGVAIPHAGLLNLVRWHCESYGVGCNDRATLLANPAFDAAVWEIWPYLAAGASLHLPAEEARLSPPAIVRFWRSEGITWSFLPTPLAEEVLAEPAALAGLSLKGLLCGGDRLHRAPGVGLPFALINHYGPSEVSVVSTMAAVPPGTPGAPPIGRPVHNLRACVVDLRGGLALRGAAGELWVGGAGLARGYLGQPALTAERFVPDPWCREAGERLYRTGDLVRLRPDGSLEFLGRIDQQIKLRGFRIEPGEIEAVLRAHPAVSEAVVGAQAQRLVAWVVSAGEQAPSAHALRELLRERLPGYMVPSAFVALPALPLTPNGKLDRGALPAPALELGAREPSAPRTPGEALLAGIFAEVLGLERVGVAEDFFALGGHSLLATQVTSRVRSVFGVELPVRAVFEAPTVEGLSGRLEGSAGERFATIPRVSRQGSLPLSFAQQRLWFLDQLEPGSSVYNIPAAVELTGRLDVAALAAALSEVVRRHEALRTAFPAVAGKPVQLVAEPAVFGLPQIDLQELPGSAREKEESRLAAAEARRPFDLGRGPLLRTALLRLGAERHVLLLAVHHIVSDGWSMGALVREIGALYGSFLAGRPSPLPELDIQYADFAAWQRRHLSGEVLDAELAWWRGQLAGMPPALELPADHPRPAVRSSRGAEHAFRIGAEGVGGLTVLSRRHGSTLFMTLLAGFVALLHRSTGEDDLVVGTPVAGRTRTETEPLIGLFVNTLALRTNVAGDPDVTALLARVRETALAAYAHQELPFERLVEELAPERDLSRTPLVQVLLALQNAPAGRLELPGLALTASGVGTGTAKLDLTWTLTETDRGLEGTIEYSRDLFEGATIARLADGFVRLLTGAAANPALRLAELPLLSAAERRQLLIEWNDVGTLPPADDTTLHGLFAAQAVRTPEAVALVEGSTGERWTYRELDLWSDSLACRLVDLGVGPEVRAGVCLPRTPLLVATLLGVLKAGGAYVPLDPEYPRERLDFLVEDSGAVVVVREDLASSPTALSVPVQAQPGNLAYLIYTSGSTGRPKGVAIEHRSAVAFARWARTMFTPEELAGVLAATSVSFDLSVFELFVTLAWGGKVILAANALELPRLAAAAEVVLVNTVPSAMEELVRLKALPPSVRTVNLAGEPLRRSLAYAIQESSPTVRLLDLYGPSESTTYSTWAAVAQGERREPAIGRPIAGTRVALLGRSGELMPAGVPGELFLGGAGLARGYFNRPDLTAERFVPDPFSTEEGAEPGGRLYRTGDLARFLPDGRLEYLGRIDQQVKVRGFRIELGEVEAALLAHGAVQAAAVLARQDLPGGTGLVAYVVAAPPLPSPLRDFLRERLPEFMVPAAFVFLESLPLTPNGKVDRKALAKMPLEREADRAGAAPRTPTEELVAGIFAEVLGLERVDVEESFFALGGHSLLATQVTSRVRSVFGVELPVRAVFEAPTVAGLSGRLEGSAGERSATIQRVSRQGSLLLSFAQQRLWFLDQLEPGSPLYNIPAAVELTGRLGVAALAAALSEVVRRHEALRTRFLAGPDGPVQVVDAAAPLVLPQADLSALPRPESRQEEARLTGEAALQAFDLAQGPLLRMLLLRRGEDDWVLVLSMHHIVSDGWSLGVLIREVGALYPAFLEGRPSPLPELAIQYADFAAWQRRLLSGERLAAELAWWCGELAGAPPVLDLPTDRPRRGDLGPCGATHGLTLPPAALSGLTEISQRFGVTRFMSLLAAFAVLLQRYSGQDDLTVGTPVAGRTRAEVEDLIGLFVNTLVVRIDLRGNPPLGELLGRVRERMLAAFAHQEMPFERLVEELAPERDLRRPPLVQVMLALDNVPAGVLALPGLELHATSPGTGTAKFELTLGFSEVAGETGDGLVGTIEYRSDLFDGTTIARLAGHFERLLVDAMAAPAKRLADLLLLSDAERHELLVEWGTTQRGPHGEPRPATTLDALFAARVERTPEAVALVFEGETLTYRALNEQVDILARHLRRCGAGPETIVGVCLEPSPGLVIALFAIWRAGGGFLPLDPAYPAERLTYMVEDSGAALVLTHRGLADLPAAGARQIMLDEVQEPDGNPGKGVPEPASALPASLAYVIYTSGSTGRPKGVAVQQGAAADYMETIAAAFALSPEDRLLQFASPSFDLWLEETVPALVTGATLVLRGPELWEPSRFLARIQELELTVVDLSTAYWHQWVEELAAQDVPACLSLRLVVAGGEVMAVEAARRWWRSPLRGVRLFNSYGPTEAVISATFYDVDAPAATTTSVSLGCPLPGRAVYVMDRRGHLLPVGVPGEIFLGTAPGGSGLARGYLNRPDLTAERFVPDPFSVGEGAEPGGRLYRTGDLARCLPDGRLEYLGRIDQQVKVRGFRIELEEVEAALLAHGAVQTAAVLARQDLSGGMGLVAYVVADLPSANPLRDFVRERLPEFMVPAAFVFLESLPLTPNGKVDRKALASFAIPRWEGKADRAGAAPRTPTEELVAGIFAEVLGLERVDVEESFFALGGHSLLATQVTSRVRAVFGVELPVRAVFESPTVVGLAGRLEASAEERSATIPRVSRQELLPLSFAQQRLWFLDQLEPGSTAYNIPVAVELTGRLGVAALEVALGEVVRRHEALRTAFPAVAGKPVQLVAEPTVYSLPLIDLQALPDEERAEEARRLASAEAGRPFDLGRGPLLRTALVKWGAEQHTVLVTMHHIVSDGWSVGVLVRELGALYPAFLEGRPSPLPELALQYADFAAWQRRHLAGEVLDAELAWWREQLAGMPPALELPADHPRPADRSTRGAVDDFTLESAGLPELSRRHGTTVFMLLLAGFAGLLQRFTGEEDLAVGTPIAGRTRVEAEPLIGFFVNTLVLRLDLSGSPSFLDLLGRVRETALAAYAHQEVPFERLVEELAPERDRSRPPLVQVLFALQNAPSDSLALPGLEITASPLATETAKLELSCVLTESERRLAGALEYNRDLFDRATAARLTAGFARFLEAAVDAPEARVADLPVLSPAERAALLFEWNDTAEAPRAPLVHELFAEQARRQPEALAVAAPGERLSYGELAARAGRLARILARLGVGPEVRVALCAGATVHRVVGSLAVLLAGGAYVLMDPEAPPERLAFLVADSAAAAVLTERSLAGRFERCAVPLVELESGEGEVSGSLPVPAVGPENLAYVVYTSGSTGLPKGVAVSHAGLLNLVSWHRAVYGLSPADRATLIASPAFDAAVWELWPCLAAGASVHIPEDETRISPPAIVRFWRSEGITWSFLPTPLAEQVLMDGAALTGLALKGLLCGGDRLHLGPGPDVPFALINHYGPSEVSVVSTSATVPPDTVGAPPIGRPIQNVRTCVADARGTLMPRGAAGELWIGGASLARGYLGRPALTAERFVPDPWSGEAGERLYRTGDLVRHRPGGSFEFLGRIDHQIKLRGFRIEPGEIEAALCEHPAVSEAAVTVLARQRLVAYVVGSGERVPSDRELRDFLRLRLPGFMVPAAYVTLTALPLTSHGKLDRKALPDPDPADAVSTPPRTPVEERLAGIFAEVLGVARVGVEDDFFALGGHSLLAVQVAARVRSAFGVELPVRSVFETPTVEGLAAWVERSTGEDRPEVPAPTPIVRVSREQPLALSFAQQRLWFLERIEPGAPFFHLPAALDCQGRLDPAALARSLGEILLRHEVLRTRFALTGRRPVQIPLAPAELAVASLLPCIDLSAFSVLPVQEAEVARLTAAEACRPFDLERGPLLHAVLVRLGPESHRLLLTMHHIAADAWSVALLIRELGQLYASFAAGRPSPLPDLAVQYADFAAWQRDRLRGERLDGHLRFWTERLGPRLPTLELPTDRPRPPVQSHRGASRLVRLDAGTTGGMRRLAGSAGVTLFMAVLAVFQAVLARHSGQEDIVVGTAVAERPDPVLDRVIGLFLNTLVLRSDLSGDPTFRELLGRVHGVVLGALAHAELPFERLVEAMQPERDLSRSPLFQVFFALRNEPLPAFDLPGLVLRPADTSARAAQFDLSLHLEESGGGFDGAIEYNPDLFDGATVERLALHCGILLAGAVAGPDRRLSALPLLSEAERAELVVEWNDTRSAAPGAAVCIHEMFQAQVERTPDAVAALDAEASVTYRELANRASRLAERLVLLGVRPGDRVGVCVERSLPMLVSLLAVLESGAAYVPLDPAYPQARLAAMLTDSQATALIATESAGGSLHHPRTLSPADLPPEEDGSVPLPAVPAGSAAYILYTSGSTGTPKGVVVTHANACNLFVAIDAELRPVFRSQTPGVWLAVTSICFDISVVELLWTMTRGFKVVIHDGPDVAEQIGRHGVSHLQCTPSMAGMLAAIPERLRSLAPLSHLLLGGEALPRPLADRLAATVTGEVRNLYGPTETTVYSLGQRIERGEAKPLIGRPLSNTEAYLLDASLRPVPLGACGEVFLGGDGMALGYWRRPDLTAERFVPDPLGSRPGGRLYRTGDLARQYADGRFDYIGRADHQVKVRGVRIELGEIEAVLRSSPAVAQAVATVREDARGDRRLIAYLVPVAGGADRDLAAGELRRFLAARLPEPMIPSTFVPLAALPLTQNGKIDRRALPAPEVGRPRLESAYAAPRTPREKTLAAVWQEVLGHERIGIHDNFFELGGSSLLLVEIESRLREVLGREIPIAQMFRNPTIHGLSLALAAEEREPAEAVEPMRPQSEGASGGGSTLDRQRQFMAEMKRRRAEQRRPGR